MNSAQKNSRRRKDNTNGCKKSMQLHLNLLVRYHHLSTIQLADCHSGQKWILGLNFVGHTKGE